MDLDPALTDGSREDAHNLDDVRDRHAVRATHLRGHRGPTTPEMRRNWRIQREKEQERTR